MADTDAQSVSPSQFYEEVSLSDHKGVRREKIKIMKNLLLICTAFLFNFTAFGGISNLQSSLNYEEGLGTASLAIIYGALIISALVSPTYVIKKIGCKWTIFACIIGYTTYSLANFYASWYTLVPSSIIVGLCGAPLWSAKCAYLTTSARRYARLTGEDEDAVVNRFFGIFFLFFQFNQIIGNLISSFVLSSSDAASLIFPNNVTAEDRERIEKYCGADNCQIGFGKEENATDEVTDETLYTLMGIYTGVGVLAAVIVALFVDKIVIRNQDPRNTKQLFLATVNHMRDRRQQLLIFLTMYSGFEQAFITSDYTQSFITCPLAVNWVGFVMICYGGCDSIFSFFFGRIEKYTGRPPLFSFAMLINIALIITFLTWTPIPSSEAPFFINAAFWGIADAVWQTQLNALYGVLFFNRQEESFANYRLWESLGFVIAFGYQNYACVYVKLYVLLSVLLCGMALYYYVEYREHKKLVRAVSDEQPQRKESFGDTYENAGVWNQDKSAVILTGETKQFDKENSDISTKF